jgi:hypothetical protein
VAGRLFSAEREQSHQKLESCWLLRRAKRIAHIFGKQMVLFNVAAAHLSIFLIHV